MSMTRCGCNMKYGSSSSSSCTVFRRLKFEILSSVLMRSTVLYNKCDGIIARVILCIYGMRLHIMYLYLVHQYEYIFCADISSCFLDIPVAMEFVLASLLQWIIHSWIFVIDLFIPIRE